MSTSIPQRPILDQIDDRRYRVRSRRSGHTYYAYVGPDGDVYCSCPAGLHGRDCYHARAILDERVWLRRIGEIEARITCRTCRAHLGIVRAMRPGDRIAILWRDESGIMPDRRAQRTVRDITTELGHLAIITHESRVPVWCERIADLWRQEVER
jgi:hypothetical protein